MTLKLHPVLVRSCAPLTLMLALSACDSGGDDHGVVIRPTVPSIPSTSSSSSTGGSAGSSSSSSSSSSGSNLPVNDSVTITPVVTTPTLQAGGSTAIALTFSDAEGQPLTTFGDWQATSRCIANSMSSISPATRTPTEVNFTYDTSNCVGTDTVTFFTDHENQRYQTTTDLEVEEDSVSAIRFVSAAPSQIAIRGSGGVDTSVLTFALDGVSGTGVASQEVRFSLSGSAGDVKLVDEVASSNAEGLVQARVQAGTTPIVVTVVAEHVATGESATSKSLIVANGLTADGRFNAVPSIYNPDALRKVNTPEVTITTVLTDRVGNPVADGTAVNFVSEVGGIIGESCVTVDSVCTVIWKPSGMEDADGRVTVFATTKGTEGYVDQNGNLVFDNTEENNFTDTAEPFADFNGSGAYEAGEYFVDSNANGTRDGGDGYWNGLSCIYPGYPSDSPLLALATELCSFRPTGSTSTGVANSVDLGDQFVLQLSDGENPLPCRGEDSGGVAVTLPESMVAEQTITTPEFYFHDGNANALNGAGAGCAYGNSLPGGSKVTVTGAGARLSGAEKISNTAQGPNGPYSITYTAPKTAGRQEIQLVVETGSTKNTYTYAVNVTVPAP